MKRYKGYIQGPCDIFDGLDATIGFLEAVGVHIKLGAKIEVAYETFERPYTVEVVNPEFDWKKYLTDVMYSYNMEGLTSAHAVAEEVEPEDLN